MKLIKSITTAIAALAVIALTGCGYVPPGTVRITGGSGASVFAFAGIGLPGEDDLTTLQTTINLNLLGEKTKGFTEPTFGTINFQDLGNGVNIQGTVVDFIDEEYTGPTFPGLDLPDFLPGIEAFCVGRARGGDGKWFDVQFLITVTKIPTELDAPLRSIVVIYSPSIRGIANPEGYFAAGFFIGGNFVFHGQDGVVLK